MCLARSLANPCLSALRREDTALCQDQHQQSICTNASSLKYIKHIANIYQKYIQIYRSYIEEKYKIPSVRRPGRAQARPKPGAAHWPDRDRAAPGLGRAWAGGRLVFWIFLRYSLDIFGYVLVYLWYIFGYFYIACHNIHIMCCWIVFFRKKHGCIWNAGAYGLAGHHMS